ncbi:effector-associated constant component EACC1 [Streptomyces sp. 8N616]|uniref:effector-associated constant component EACC1 n=1 Tax=Streptomyces sp. 8N616 TaxID=3457414 RepID=UPI003FD163A9
MACLESLSDWLRGDPDFAGRVRVSGPSPGPNEMGGIADHLIIAVGSSGTLIVGLAGALKVWLSHPRRSDVRVKVRCANGRTVELDAKRVAVSDVENMFRLALNGENPE